MSAPLGKPPTLPPTPDAGTEPPGGRGAPLGPAPLPRLALGSSGRAGGHGRSSLRMRRGGGAPLGRAPRPPLHAPTQREKLERAQLQAAQNAAKPKTAPAPTPAKAAPIPIAKPEENPQKTRFRNKLASALARKSPAKRQQMHAKAGAIASTVAAKRAEQYKGIDATLDALRQPPAPAQTQAERKEAQP